MNEIEIYEKKIKIYQNGIVTSFDSCVICI